ncbi:MAG: LD-carboxypeptidase [Defluviitaleaceae bacterium]|nr:LD-carboxypeptidase [Defluviitaleaceae bacterium]
MTTPTPLKQNDKVALIATSGIVNPQKLNQGIKILENMGLRPYVSQSCYASHEYLAGDDTLRLHDLHAAFADTQTRAIFVARGGYGAARLLPHIDYGLIAKNPKIFAGYSDVTALHIAINQNSGLVTYHAPMPAADLPTADKQTLDSFYSMLFTQSTQIHFDRFSELAVRITAPITGGNLTLIASTLGTPYEIDTRGKMLFMEEVNEEPYKIDRLLTQLKHAGKLRDALGFILGSFTTPSSYKKIQLAISELLFPENKPIISHFPSGHCMPNITFPLGQNAEILMEAPNEFQIHFQNQGMSPLSHL